MNPSSRRSNFEPGLYILAFALALGLRFVQLGAPLLSDAEAAWAMQALDVTRGLRPALGPQPGYVMLTSALFYLMDSTNFLARFWPALFGGLLTLAPLAFRERIGRTPALVLAFGLALDPGLVSLSRQAGSLIPALGAAALAWAAWERRKPSLAGFFAGLALLGGPSLWLGLLIFGLAYALAQGLLPAVETGAGPNVPARSVREELKLAGAYALGTLLVAGTLFFLSPNGISAALASLPAFLNGWGRPSGVPATRLLLALAVYQPLPVLFAVAALLRAAWMRRQIKNLPEDAPSYAPEAIRKKSAPAFRLGLWALVALLLALFYPAHEIGDLAWALVPLWALAALEISHHLNLPDEDRQETFGALALTVALLAFAWLDFASLNFVGYQSTDWTTRIYLLIGALALLVLSLFLVALGWSSEIALRGGVWGVLAVLVFYSLSAAWGGTGLRTPDGVELWLSEAQPGQLELIARTVDDASDWSTGVASHLPVLIVGVDSPALEWALRRHPVGKAASLDLLSTPEVVISPEMNELSLPAAYRGQDFYLRHSPVWSQLPAFDWIRWLTSRDFPRQSDVVVLWVRDDLFIDATAQP
ncbi:MAG: hypothetical protein AB1846_10085 [Chloroflexota bacterium]